jgi:hypothetical protein
MTPRDEGAPANTSQPKFARRPNSAMARALPPSPPNCQGGARCSPNRQHGRVVGKAAAQCYGIGGGTGLSREAAQ